MGRPGAVALAAALVVFAAGALHLQRFESAVGSAAGTDQVVADPDEPVDAVGPRVGADLDAYVAGRRERLAALEDQREIRAVVSFANYLDATSLDLPDGVVVERLLVRLPLLDQEPRDLDLDGRDPGEVLAEVAEEEREGLVEEEDELASLLASEIEDEAFVAEFERRLEEVSRVRRALDDDPALLYAVVVRGRVGELRPIQTDPGVRLVDPAGASALTADTRFFGLLPDDEARATHGRPL